MKETFKYFEIGRLRFKVEKISEDHYELTVIDNFMAEDREFYSYNFTGETAYAEVMEEILSYSEISEDEYDEA